MKTKSRLAAPSCVLPAHVAPNCRALAEEVREVGLMLLEAQGCLAYSQSDIPADLAELGLFYHAHLPVDLPWSDDISPVISILSALSDKVAFLQPWSYVLHPPKARQLEHLALTWPEAHKICLENTHQSDLVDIWPIIQKYNLGVCLDIGHLKSYKQWNMLKLPGFFDHVQIMHVYGGEEKNGHLELEHFDPCLFKDLLQSARPKTIVVELFAWDKWIRSLHLLRSWMTQWGMDFD